MTEQLELDLQFGAPRSAPKRRTAVTPQTRVEDFHRATGSAINERTSEVMSLRRRLISEEYRELRDELVVAHQALVRGEPIPNLDKIAKEMADVLYVVFGTAVSLDIDLIKAFVRVHQSNMSKLVDGEALLREDGKVLKGPNYFDPDMTGTYREEA